VDRKFKGRRFESCGKLIFCNAYFLQRLFWRLYVVVVLVTLKPNSTLNVEIPVIKNFVVSNKNFCSIRVTTGISRKRKYDFSCPCWHFYVIKNSINIYRRKFILEFNKRRELVLLIHEKSFGIFFDDVIIKTIKCKIL